MKGTIQRLCIIMVAMLSCTAVFAQYRTDYSELTESETVTSLKEHVSYISSTVMEGRKAGSEGEKETAAYIWEQFNKAGIETLAGKEGQEFKLALPGQDTVISRNVVGYISGHSQKLRDHYIVVGARMDNLGVNSMTFNGRPYDQIYYGANGNASGVAMMIELAKMLKTNEYALGRTVIFVGFGASEQTFAGAWYFLNRSFPEPDKIDVMVNLDMVGTGGDGFSAYTTSNYDLNIFLKNLENSLQPILPKVTAVEPYPSDHRAFYSAKIPSIYFSTGQYAEHDSERDTGAIIDYESMERELEYVYNCTRELSVLPSAPLFNNELRDAPKSDNRVYSYQDCDRLPTFLGSSDPRKFLSRWVYQYLKYPHAAIENGIQGRVMVRFVIGKDGKVRDAMVTKSVDPLLDAEALRVVGASPAWKAGMVNGKRVDSYIILPIEFKLTDKGSFGIRK